MIRVLVTGSRGQVGAEVVRALAGRAEVIAHDRATLDLANRAQVAAAIRAAKPDVIVNAAAYTAVDRAESDAETAHAVNADAPGVIGAEAKRLGALLVHYSTDYVFDGTSPRAYLEDDATKPVNVYGETKLAGERAVAASGAAHVTLRTSWVYGPRGRNFLLTMLDAAAKRPELRVVDEQRGAPTSSIAIARATLEILSARGTGELAPGTIAAARERSGLYHASAGGETTWFGFAQAIFEGRARRVHSSQPRIVPIPTRDYPTPARRPANSVLSNARLEATFGVRLAEWREGLEEVLSVLPG